MPQLGRRRGSKRHTHAVGTVVRSRLTRSQDRDHGAEQVRHRCVCSLQALPEARGREAVPDGEPCAVQERLRYEATLPPGAYYLFFGNPRDPGR